MEDEGRIAKLAEIAATITDLSVHEQITILTGEGLKLTDINWENCNDSDPATPPPEQTSAEAG